MSGAPKLTEAKIEALRIADAYGSVRVGRNGDDGIVARRTLEGLIEQDLLRLKGKTHVDILWSSITPAGRRALANLDKASPVTNLGRGHFGIVARRGGFVLEKRQDSASGLTYYVVHNQAKMWSDDAKPWGFREAKKILETLAAGKQPDGATAEKFREG